VVALEAALHASDPAKLPDREQHKMANLLRFQEMALFHCLLASGTEERFNEVLTEASNAHLAYWSVDDDRY
jgi:hypothetical protein